MLFLEIDQSHKQETENNQKVSQRWAGNNMKIHNMVGGIMKRDWQMKYFRQMLFIKIHVFYRKSTTINQSQDFWWWIMNMEILEMPAINANNKC